MSSGNWITISIKKKKLDFKPNLGTLSQQESQKTDFILPVLDYFLENKFVNATELEAKLPISRDSIDRTIKLLSKHKIVELKQVRNRNKKFYGLKNKNIAKIYRKKLSQWVWLKEFRKNRTTIQSLSKMLHSYKKTGKYLILHYKKNLLDTRKATDILDKPLIIERNKGLKNSSKKTLRPVLLNNLPHSRAMKIIRDYLNGKFCGECLKKDRLCSLILDSNELEQGCKYGHVIPLTV